MHVEGVEATTAAVVATLATTPAPTVARFLLGSPCTSVFVPLVVGRPTGEPADASRFFALRERGEAAVRPVLDDLERGLEADVRDDDAWGVEAWRRVDEALRLLGV